LTDCPCCLIFIVAILGFCAASGYGWQKGDPRKLLIGWDSDGNGCGFSEVTKDYPHLYWAEPPTNAIFDAIKTLNVNAALSVLNTGTCVKECPQADPATSVNCKVTKSMASNPSYSGCTFNIDLAYLEKWGIDSTAYIDKFYTGDKSKVTQLTKIPFRYNTSKMFGFCLPTIKTDSISAVSEKTLDTFMSLFQSTIMDSKVTEYMSDIAMSWKVLAVSSATAIVLGYIYLILIRFMGAVLVWLSIILVQLSLIAAGIFTFFQARNYEDGSDNNKWLKISAYVIWGVAGLYLICICCCWNAIRIGIAVYQTTAEYIAKNMRIFLLPLVTYIVAGSWFAIWLASFVFIFSVGEPTHREPPY